MIISLNFITFQHRIIDNKPKARLLIIPLELSEIVQVIGLALYRCGVVAVSTLV